MPDAEPEIAVVDVAALRTQSVGSPEYDAVLARLRRAFERTGFAVISGHGINPAILSRGLDAAANFFALPSSEKRAVAPKRWNPDAANRYRGYFPSSVNGKEGLDLGDPLLTPSHRELLARPYYEVNRLPEAFSMRDRQAVDDYFSALARFGGELAHAIVESLGLDHRPLVEALARPGSQSTLRFNRYPDGAPPVEISVEDGVALACETHVDSGFVTLLFQDRRGGLQLRNRARQWIDVPYLPDSLIVNLGRAGERLTRGRFRATPHRVRHEAGARISIPFFLEPRHDFPIGPSALGPREDETHPTQTYEAFLDASLAAFDEYAER